MNSVNAPAATDLTLRVYVGATKVLEKLLTPNQNSPWRVVVDLFCLNASNSQACVTFTQGGVITQLDVSVPAVTYDASATKLVKFTGQAAVAFTNSVVQYGMDVELIP